LQFQPGGSLPNIAQSPPRTGISTMPASNVGAETRFVFDYLDRNAAAIAS
jgi:hypothetical protein